jgi:hypothetical protein
MDSTFSIKEEPQPYFDPNSSLEKFKSKIYEAEMDLKASSIYSLSNTIVTSLYNMTIDGCLEFIENIDTLKNDVLRDAFIKEGIPKICKSLLSKKYGFRVLTC